MVVCGHGGEGVATGRRGRLLHTRGRRTTVLAVAAEEEAEGPAERREQGQRQTDKRAQQSAEADYQSWSGTDERQLTVSSWARGP
jgi:NAD(P)H-hydrate repair Nnr-like enzyme with NAD(P)H-hydrate epimerase domain